MARQARYVVQKAPGVDGNPIPPDEPCIVIRAQDKLAPSMVDYYLALYQAVEVLHPGTLDNEVIAELEHHRVAIEKWQQEHPTKYADR